MKNHINRFIRRAFLVALFLPYMAIVAIHVSSEWAIAKFGQLHAWVMKKTPIERKFAK